MSTERNLLLEIEENGRGKSKFLHCRLRLPNRKRQRSAAQRLVRIAMPLMCLALALMAATEVGLVLLLAFQSSPEIAQILLTFLRFLLPLLAAG